MQHTSRKLFSALSAFALFATVTACGESSTAPGGESEVISRVTLTLTPQSGGIPLVVFIDDPDGNGPQAPATQVGALTFRSGVAYTGTVRFENRLVNPPENITEEVQEESNEHRVFYSANGAGIVVTATDVDLQGRPLGISFAVVAGNSTGAGSLRTVLCHYADSPKPSSATSCTVDTDIDVVFNYTITN